MSASIFNKLIALLAILISVGAHAFGDFHRVYLGPKFTEMSTYNGIKINWDLYIPLEYIAIRSGEIPKQYLKEFLVKKNMWGNVTYKFKSDLPTNFESKHFYQISDIGIKEVTVNQMLVTIRFSIDRKNEIGHIVKSGSFLPQSDSLGFIFITDEVGTYSIDGINIDGVDFQRPYKKKFVFGDEGYEVAKSFTVTQQSNGQKINFIQLKPNLKDVDCFYRAFITTSEIPFKQLAWSASGCDV